MAWPVHSSLMTPHSTFSFRHASGGEQTFSEHSPSPQVPQSSVPPHPSEIVPQFLPRAWQLVLWHVVHVWLMASHTSWPEQVFGHAVMFPQPSTTLPHFPWQSTGAHPLQVWEVPSHSWPLGQVPHEIPLPQASFKKPHLAEAIWHAFVTQVCVLASHVWLAFMSHVPHSSRPLQATTTPQVAWSIWQVVFVHAASGEVPNAGCPASGTVPEGEAPVSKAAPASGVVVRRSEVTSLPHEAGPSQSSKAPPQAKRVARGCMSMDVSRSRWSGRFERPSNGGFE